METIFFLVCNILHVFVMYSYVDKVLVRRYSKKTVGLMWGVTYVMDEIVIQFNKIEIVNFFAMTILLMSLFIVGYKSGVKKAFITYLFYNIFMLASEMLTMCIFSIAGIKPQEEYMLGSAISKILTIVIIRIVLVIIHNKNIVDISFRLWVCILSIPLSSTALVVIWDLNIGIDSNEVINILALIFVLLINYVAFYMFDDLLQVMVLKGQNQLLNQQREYYHNQCIQVQKLWEDMREFRHDIKNRYIHEKLLLKNGEYYELSKCYDKAIDTINGENIYAKSGNVYIDSIINYKLIIVKQLGADINCELRIPSNIDAEYDDIITILGNLMDNAIEALDKVKNGNKYFEIRMIYDNSGLLINVANTYEGELKKSRGGLFMTSKSDKGVHGIGLRSIQKIIEVHRGMMSISTEENIFKVLLCIPIK